VLSFDNAVRSDIKFAENNPLAATKGKMKVFPFFMCIAYAWVVGQATNNGVSFCLSGYSLYL